MKRVQFPFPLVSLLREIQRQLPTTTFRIFLLQPTNQSEMIIHRLIVSLWCYPTTNLFSSFHVETLFNPLDYRLLPRYHVFHMHSLQMRAPLSALLVGICRIKKHNYLTSQLYRWRRLEGRAEGANSRVLLLALQHENNHAAW